MNETELKWFKETLLNFYLYAKYSHGIEVLPYRQNLGLQYDKVREFVNKIIVEEEI